MGVGEEEVLGLEVAVADPAVVAVPHAGQELAEVVPRRSFVGAAVHLLRRGGGGGYKGSGVKCGTITI